MLVKKKIIKVPVGSVMRIAEANKVSRATVYNALNYNSSNEQAQIIRREAIDLYGGVTTEKIMFG